MRTGLQTGRDAEESGHILLSVSIVGSDQKPSVGPKRFRLQKSAETDITKLRPMVSKLPIAAGVTGSRNGGPNIGFAELADFGAKGAGHDLDCEDYVCKSFRSSHSTTVAKCQQETYQFLICNRQLRQIKAAADPRRVALQMVS